MSDFVLLGIGFVVGAVVAGAACYALVAVWLSRGFRF